MSQLRKIQRNVEKEEEAIIPLDHHKLPVGKVLTAPVKGEFMIFPLLVWVSLRMKTKVPLVMIRSLMFKSVEEPTPVGILQLELPVYEDTERGVLGVLERFGWDGRIWPLEPGWPDGDETETANLNAVLRQASLKNTLVFPPGESGVAAQPINVARAKGPFLMKPLPIPENEPNPELLAKLRDLCADPTKLLSSSNN
jgi:hypothetical protein